MGNFQLVYFGVTPRYTFITRARVNKTGKIFVFVP